MQRELGEENKTRSLIGLPPAPYSIVLSPVPLNIPLNRAFLRIGYSQV